jgi:hypothetical protein
MASLISRASWFIEEDVHDSKGKPVLIPLEEDVCQQLSEAYLTKQWGQKIVIGDHYFILSRTGTGRMYRYSVIFNQILVENNWRFVSSLIIN